MSPNRIYRIVCIAVSSGAALCSTLVDPSFADGGTAPSSSSSAAPSSSGATVAPAGATIEDTDPAWTWSGMTQLSDTRFHGGSARIGNVGTYAIYTFHGTTVTVYGFAGTTLQVDGNARPVGSATFSIDGKAGSTLSLKSADDDYQHVVFKASDLPDGNHVLKVAAASDWIAIDYIVSSDSTQSGDAGKLYRIVPKYAQGDFLQMSAVHLPDGGAIQIGATDPALNEVWRVVSLGPGCFRISPVDDTEQAVTFSKTVLTYAKTGTLLNPIVLAKYTGADEQKWAIVPITGQWYGITLYSNPRMFLNIWKDDGFVVGYLQTYPSIPDNELWNFVPVNGSQQR